MVSQARQNAQIQTFELGSLKWNTGPLGLIMYAKDFAESARILPEPEHFAPTRYYLACHAIELGLKAFLALHGRPLAELLEKFGHRLDKILADCDAEGLAGMVPLTDDLRLAITKASGYYNAKVFEYPTLTEAVRGYSDRPSVYPLMATADLLVDRLYAPCRDLANA